MRRVKISRLPFCPKCDSGEVVPIIYGMPLEIIEKPEKGLLAAEKKGYIELGGCCVDENNPNFRCKSCGKGFRR